VGQIPPAICNAIKGWGYVFEILKRNQSESVMPVGANVTKLTALSEKSLYFIEKIV
jgi:hypothetical protein